MDDAADGLSSWLSMFLVVSGIVCFLLLCLGLRYILS